MFKIYDETVSQWGGFKIYDEPESPHEGAFGSPNEGGVLKKYDEPVSAPEGRV